jgi:hypothetical protein
MIFHRVGMLNISNSFVHRPFVASTRCFPSLGQMDIVPMLAFLIIICNGVRIVAHHSVMSDRRHRSGGFRTRRARSLGHHFQASNQATLSMVHSQVQHAIKACIVYPRRVSPHLGQSSILSDISMSCNVCYLVL